MKTIFFSFFKLVNGSESLLQHVENVETKFIVQREDHNCKPKYAFHAFENYKDYLEYRSSLINQERYTHHEVGLGRVKMVLDVDLKEETDDQQKKEIFCYLARIIEKAFYKEYGIDLQEKNWIMCSSHGQDKTSFHFIVDGYCFENYHERKVFFQKCMTLAQEEKCKYWHAVDSGIYEKNHALRLLFEKKNGTGRQKIFIETMESIPYTWRPMDTFESNVEKKQVQFRASAISVTDHCTLVKKKDVLLISPPKKNILIPDIQEKIDAIRKVFDIGAFSADYDGTFIILRRNHPSMCPICKREHSSENAYICIMKNRFFFHCHREDKKGGLEIILPLPERNKDICNENEKLREASKIIRMKKWPVKSRFKTDNKF